MEPEQNTTARGEAQAQGESTPPTNATAACEPPARPKLALRGSNATAACEPPARPKLALRGSEQKAGVGRILHVYSDKWAGPRPGIVVGGPFKEARVFTDGETQCVNVNVFLDGANDAEALKACRESPCGNTLGSAPLFEPLSHEQRVSLLGADPACFGNNGNGISVCWCEWPR